VGNSWNLDGLDEYIYEAHFYLCFPIYFVQNNEEMSNLRHHQVLAYIDAIAELSYQFGNHPNWVNP